MGTLLSQPNTEQHSGEVKGKMMSCGYTSMQGWRRTMEDAHIVNLDFVTENGLTATLLAVFDGHGGDQVAAYCEKAFVSTLVKTEAFKAGDYKKALIETNISLDEQMLTESTNDFIKTLGSSGNNLFDGLYGDYIAMGMGCTAVVCLIIDGVLYCSNAGDSRSVLYENNVVQPLSVDHKPQLQSEIDRIAKAGGVIENGRVNGNLNLTRTIGDLMYKRDSQLKPEEQIISCYPDVHEHKLTGKEQLLVLACDGIWDCLTNEGIIQKILEHLGKGMTLKETVETITSDCVSKEPYTQPGWDNMTLLVCKFEGFEVPVGEVDAVEASSVMEED